MGTEQENWVTFLDDDDEEEALSLSDLPLTADRCTAAAAVGAVSSAETEEFEFRAFGGGIVLEVAEAEMCTADEVFFRGQILPFRPSVSSDGGGAAAIRCGWRSESMDRFSGSTLGFESSRSSTSISRSHSTQSCSSSSSAGAGGGSESAAAVAPRRLSSVSSNYYFYTFPSPKPHLDGGARRRNAPTGRKSAAAAAGSGGWGLFRLGLVKTPEFELLGSSGRHHRNVGNNTGELRRSTSIASEKKSSDGKWPSRTSSCGSSSNNEGVKKPAPAPEKKKKKKKKEVLRSFLGSRLRCRCSPEDAVEPISASSSSSSSSRVVIMRMRREEEEEVKVRRASTSSCTSRSRTCEWVAELSMPKSPPPMV